MACLLCILVQPPLFSPTKDMGYSASAGPAGLQIDKHSCHSCLRMYLLPVVDVHAYVTRLVDTPLSVGLYRINANIVLLRVFYIEKRESVLEIAIV